MAIGFGGGRWDTAGACSFPGCVHQLQLSSLPLTTPWPRPQLLLNLEEEQQG